MGNALQLSNGNNNNNVEEKTEVQMHDLTEFKIKVTVVRAQTLTPYGEKGFHFFLNIYIKWKLTIEIKK